MSRKGREGKGGEEGMIGGGLGANAAEIWVTVGSERGRTQEKRPTGKVDVECGIGWVVRRCDVDGRGEHGHDAWGQARERGRVRGRMDGKD